jgi:hypothetical protein
MPACQDMVLAARPPLQHERTESAAERVTGRPGMRYRPAVTPGHLRGPQGAQLNPPSVRSTDENVGSARFRGDDRSGGSRSLRGAGQRRDRAGRRCRRRRARRLRADGQHRRQPDRGLRPVQRRPADPLRHLRHRRPGRDSGRIGRRSPRLAGLADLRQAARPAVRQRPGSDLLGDAGPGPAAHRQRRERDRQQLQL